MTNFKTIAIASVAALTLGAATAATVSEANAQAFHGDGYYRYNDPAAPVTDVVAGAIEAPVAVAGAVAGTVFAPLGAPMAGPNFGYQHWPYGDGYRGGFLNSGRDIYGY